MDLSSSDGVTWKIGPQTAPWFLFPGRLAADSIARPFIYHFLRQNGMGDTFQLSSFTLEWDLTYNYFLKLLFPTFVWYSTYFSVAFRNSQLH